MDLREKKTKRNIENAFFELRAHRDLERITVKELAERAEISKATFYLHYRDIYDLSETLCENVISDIIKGISRPENLWENPPLFIEELTTSFYAKKNIIDILFSGSQSYLLPMSIEKNVRNYIFGLRPELETDAKFNVLLTYQIQGCYFAYQEHCSHFGFEIFIESINKISEKLAELVPERK